MKQLTRKESKALIKELKAAAPTKKRIKPALMDDHGWALWKVQIIDPMDGYAIADLYVEYLDDRSQVWVFDELDYTSTGKPRIDGRGDCVVSLFDAKLASLYKPRPVTPPCCAWIDKVVGR